MKLASYVLGGIAAVLVVELLAHPIAAQTGAIAQALTQSAPSAMVDRSNKGNRLVAALPGHERRHTYATVETIGPSAGTTSSHDTNATIVLKGIDVRDAFVTATKRVKTITIRRSDAPQAAPQAPAPPTVVQKKRPVGCESRLARSPRPRSLTW